MTLLLCKRISDSLNDIQAIDYSSNDDDNRIKLVLRSIISVSHYFAGDW